MAKVKTVLVACGRAVATSTVVARNIVEEMGKRGLEINFRQSRPARSPWRARQT